MPFTLSSEYPYLSEFQISKLASELNITKKNTHSLTLPHFQFFSGVPIEVCVLRYLSFFLVSFSLDIVKPSFSQTCCVLSLSLLLFQFSISQCAFESVNQICSKASNRCAVCTPRVAQPRLPGKQKVIYIASIQTSIQTSYSPIYTTAKTQAVRI